MSSYLVSLYDRIVDVVLPLIPPSFIDLCNHYNVHLWHFILALSMLLAFIIGTKRLIRWPAFLAIVLFLALELTTYFAIRYIVFLLEKFVSQPRIIRKYRERMKAANSYREWSAIASEADVALGCESWKSQPHSRYYNYPLLQNLHTELYESRMSGSLPRLTAALQAALHKNTAGILNEHLYSKTLVGTKYAITAYVEEVVECLRTLRARGREMIALQNEQARGGRGRARSKSPAHGRPRSTSRKRNGGVASRLSRGQQQAASALPTPSLPDSRIATSIGMGESELNSPLALLRFFQSTKRQFGATALCLSGGATLGNFHWGTVKGLLEEGLLPKVISGTSSGAVVAAVVGTRTDEELAAVLVPHVLKAELHSFEESWFKCGWRFFRERCMYDKEAWLNKLQWFAHSHAIPHMTFLEAHKRTGRILNITCTSQRKFNPSMLLNYLTTPNVCIDTAILASAAVPGFIPPITLMEKIDGVIRPYHDASVQWCDGSLQRDLPLSELSEQFGSNFFLVSQTNPHIIPFFFNARGQSGVPTEWRRRTGGYRGGFLLSALELFLKEDMKKNLRVLSELDLVPNLFGSDFSFLFLQDFQGQITLVPNASLRDYFRIICDPTLEDLHRFLHEGRLTAWRKFSMIRNRVLIGNELNACIRELMENLYGDSDKIDMDEEPGAIRVQPLLKSRKLMEQEMLFSQL